MMMICDFLPSLRSKCVPKFFTTNKSKCLIRFWRICLCHLKASFRITTNYKFQVVKWHYMKSVNLMLMSYAWQSFLLTSISCKLPLCFKLWLNFPKRKRNQQQEQQPWNTLNAFLQESTKQRNINIAKGTTDPRVEFCLPKYLL